MILAKRLSNTCQVYSLDTETRGLFGEVFAGLLTNGITFHWFNTAQEGARLIESLDDAVVYVHNLEFDIAKLIDGGLKLEWRDDSLGTLVINNNIVRARIKTDGCVFMQDSFRLFPSSLASLSKDFNLTNGKISLEETLKARGIDKDRYFKTVKPNDPELLAYLKNDCLAVLELVDIAESFSGLSHKSFHSTPTLPSLSMKIFKERFSENWKTYTKRFGCERKEHEVFFREAYAGARTEVFNEQCAHAYHYDFNSLYPYVLQKYEYPHGIYTICQNGISDSRLEDLMSGRIKHAIVSAKVEVPECNIPVLGLKGPDGRFIFPTGIFEGTWVWAELKLAIEQGTKVLEWKKVACWSDSKPYFRDFISFFREGKENSEGAKRQFYKILQNSFYGKLGMRRERTSIVPRTPKNLERAKAKGEPIIEVYFVQTDENLYLTKREVFAPYIRPEVAAHVTAYARIELWQAMNRALSRNAKVYYCDTDSIITDLPYDDIYVHDREYGRLKLERILLKGVFVQPKLYAEVGTDGTEVCKSKGLIAKFTNTTFDGYAEWQMMLKQGKKVNIYSKVEARWHVISALVKGVPLDSIRYLSKRLTPIVPKRRFLKDGTSLPWEYSEYVDMLARKMYDTS